MTEEAAMSTEEDEAEPVKDDIYDIASLNSKLRKLQREKAEWKREKKQLLRKQRTRSDVEEALLELEERKEKEEEKKEVDRETERMMERIEAVQNVMFGFFFAFVLSLVGIVMFYETFEEAYASGRWVAYSVFLVFSMGAFVTGLFFCCIERPTRRTRGCVNSRACVYAGLFVFVVVAAVSLFQFQLYFGMLAWAYPYLLEPKALMQTDFAYSAGIRELSLDEVAQEMDWTYERMLVNHTNDRVVIGGEGARILPSTEHIGLFAHFVPVAAALIYQFGAGTEVSSLAGVIMDFVDVQDFFLLLIENDIVVSYWSNDPQLGNAVVTLTNGTSHMFESCQKRFEDWQKADLERLWLLNWWLDVDLDGPYYNFLLWKHIMIAYILASCYVTLFPFFDVVLHTFLETTESHLEEAKECDDKARAKDIARKRTCIGAVQAVLSLVCVEIPFFTYRLAASQYYEIVMSSLFIKNAVSIIIDSLKLCVYLFGLRIGRKEVMGMRDAGNRGLLYRVKSILHKCLTFGSFIGEDFDGETEDTAVICTYCCDDDDPIDVYDELDTEEEDDAEDSH